MLLWVVVLPELVLDVPDWPLNADARPARITITNRPTAIQRMIDVDFNWVGSDMISLPRQVSYQPLCFQ